MQNASTADSNGFEAGFVVWVSVTDQNTLLCGMRNWGKDYILAPRNVQMRAYTKKRHASIVQNEGKNKENSVLKGSCLHKRQDQCHYSWLVPLGNVRLIELFSSTWWKRLHLWVVQYTPDKQMEYKEGLIFDQRFASNEWLVTKGRIIRDPSYPTKTLTGLQHEDEVFQQLWHCLWMSLGHNAHMRSKTLHSHCDVHHCTPLPRHAPLPFLLLKTVMTNTLWIARLSLQIPSICQLSWDWQQPLSHILERFPGLPQTG